MSKKVESNPSRRKFIGTGIKTAALLPILSSPLMAKSKEHGKIKASRFTNSKNILILGGTSFIGPHQVAYALERGHKVSTFTRGKTKPTVHRELFKDVEQLIGDRENDLEALKGRKWDAVIDNSGRKVEWTEATAELLKDNVEQYLYVSSVSAYYPYYNRTLDEMDTLVLEMPNDVEEGEERLYDYGMMKANSELAAQRIFGENRVAAVRPTFMTGPADRTDRFMYFNAGLAKGGDIIVPGKVSDRAQYIDIRDIAEWMIRLIENGTSGVFNACGPESPTTGYAYIYGTHAAFNSKVTYVHIDDYEFLKENNIRFQSPWVLEEGKFAGMLGASNKRAIRAGLTFRPLATTALDLNEWWYSDGVSAERRKKFEDNPNEMHNRQAEIIKAWLTKKK